MSRQNHNRCAALVATLLGLSANIVLPTVASAHVKWFCAFNVAGQPRSLTHVLQPEFEQLVGLAILYLLAGALLEETPFGQALFRAMGRILQPITTHSDLLIRSVCGFFFVSLWTTGTFILTPELKTSLVWIPWLQLAIAFCTLFRQTLPLVALGIVVLFGVAVHDYGAFHLLDYPIFLGLAAYFALGVVPNQAITIRSLDILRWAASITLMWASIEKWAYPEWTFSLLAVHPNAAMGFNQEFLLRTAGMVEFSLSFALIATPLSRRCAALILAGMFIAAIFEFGKIDAIGHAPIIVVMLALAADDAGEGLARRSPYALPFGFVAALGVVLVAYYGLHSLMFGTTMV